MSFSSLLLPTSKEECHAGLEATEEQKQDQTISRIVSMVGL